MIREASSSLQFKNMAVTTTMSEYLDSLTLDSLRSLAEEIGVKEEGLGWAQCCPPKGNKQDILMAIRSTLEDLDSLTLDSLRVLAERLGIKEKGVGWAQCCPPKGNKQDIIAAINSQGCLQDCDGEGSPATPTSGKAVENWPSTSPPKTAKPKQDAEGEHREEKAKLPVEGDEDDDGVWNKTLSQPELEALKLDALKQVAESCGLKRPGVGWKVCCPPHGIKNDIIAALMCYLDEHAELKHGIAIEGDTQTFVWDDLPSKHSSEITGFRSRSGCWDCFTIENLLDRTVIQRLYTEDGLFKTLNVTLASPRYKQRAKFTKMFTMLLSEAIFHEAQARKTKLPRFVYRGLSAVSPKLLTAYKGRVGGLAYFHSFTSTTMDREVASEFMGEDGWLLRIEVPSDAGVGSCMTSVAHLSEYPEEKEILIAANAGFQVEAVDEGSRIIDLTLVDETHCLRDKPLGKQCACHKSAC